MGMTDLFKHDSSQNKIDDTGDGLKAFSNQQTTVSHQKKVFMIVIAIAISIVTILLGIRMVLNHMHDQEVRLNNRISNMVAEIQSDRYSDAVSDIKVNNGIKFMEYTTNPNVPSNIPFGKVYKYYNSFQHTFLNPVNKLPIITTVFKMPSKQHKYVSIQHNPNDDQIVSVEDKDQWTHDDTQILKYRNQLTKVVINEIKQNRTLPQQIDLVQQKFVAFMHNKHRKESSSNASQN